MRDRGRVSSRTGKVLVVLALAVLTVRAAGADVLASPDGRIRLAIEVPGPGSNAVPRWSASFRGMLVLANCALGLQTVADGELLAGARPIRTESQSVNQTVTVPFGRAEHAADRYHETRYTLRAPDHGPVDVVIRCYDDAIALRYELPSVPGKVAPTVIADEATSFRLEGNPRVFLQQLENYTTSHEHNVVSMQYRDIPAEGLLDLPVTFLYEDGTYMAITEAALRRYAGMALARPTSDDTVPRLVSRLTPRPDGTKVVGGRPLRTPWRVVLIADRPGALLESETLFCLNEPPVIGDLSWLRPGKITFPWWNGDVYDGHPGEPILSFQMAKRYIDFCAANGIAAHSLTSTEGSTTPWYRQSKSGVEPGSDTDVTRARDGFDLPAIRRYAESRGVRLWTWVHQRALRGRVEEAFAAFERMGWSGVMVDFFDHDDQESVELAESILASAARHHILVHLHGVWKPTGLERTYPNLMNHEAVLNLEYLKWSDRCTPEHNLMMAFTRLIAGPMDYHLGGFRAVPRTGFKPRWVAPNVLGTRGHHLAMYVCFDNPTPMVADYPTAYEGQPGFEFVRRVPTWWDETRVLDGKAGELLVTARRKGDRWYVGAMSARRPREVAVPLSFLPEGRFTATVWRDAAEADADPNALTTETRDVSAGDVVRIRVALDGGFVAELAPARR